MTATWGDLFERAAGYDATEDDVRRALAARREAGPERDDDRDGDETPTDDSEDG